jgi:hypothetical protein
MSVVKTGAERAALRRGGEASGIRPGAPAGDGAQAPGAGPGTGGARHTGAAAWPEPGRGRYRRVFACGTDAQDPPDEERGS